MSVEDLLRLKRAERPPAEFWDRFERELRAKQLAAIVGKRPWWAAMPKLLVGLKRYQLPVAATAILAITFVAVRYSYQTSAPAPAAPRALPASEVAVTVASAPSPDFSAAVVSETSDTPATVAVVAAPQEAVASAAPMVLSSSSAPGQISDMVPWLDRNEDTRIDSVESSAVQALVAANLEVVRATHPELVRRFLDASAGFEINPVTIAKAVDPLTRSRSPADARRERLLASSLPVATNASWNSDGKSGERLARRLSEDRLTEKAISRVELGGDRFAWKL